jgi:hypothetical protein
VLNSTEVLLPHPDTGQLSGLCAQAGVTRVSAIAAMHANPDARTANSPKPIILIFIVVISR